LDIGIQPNFKVSKNFSKIKRIIIPFNWFMLIMSIF